MTREPGKALFEDVVQATGLALMIGPGAVQRALAAVGVREPERATVDDYRRALPQLKSRMAFYLPPVELDKQLAALEAVLSS